jgi:hypothetical protein
MYLTHCFSAAQAGERRSAASMARESGGESAAGLVESKEKAVFSTENEFGKVQMATTKTKGTMSNREAMTLRLNGGHPPAAAASHILSVVICCSVSRCLATSCCRVSVELQVAVIEHGVCWLLLEGEVAVPEVGWSARYHRCS